MTINPLFAPDKMNYAQGNRPKVDCIFCAVATQNGQVADLSVHRESDFIISLNLYPYNPGHLLIFPCNHCQDVRQFTPTQENDLWRLQRMALDILDQMYKPRGYNIGFNIGIPGGASIEHVHLHIVPRFGNEPGFLDILSGTRVIVENPVTTQQRLREAFAAYRKADTPCS